MFSAPISACHAHAGPQPVPLSCFGRHPGAPSPAATAALRPGTQPLARLPGVAVQKRDHRDHTKFFLHIFYLLIKY